MAYLSRKLYFNKKNYRKVGKMTEAPPVDYNMYFFIVNKQVYLAFQKKDFLGFFKRTFQTKLNKNIEN